MTPLGAVQAGEGDVPAWTGGIKRIPKGINFDPKTQHPPNPFPDDEIKYTITAANMAAYDALLTDGHKAMLKRLPTFKMNVYQSRRSCTVPKFVQEATKRNATTVELTADGEGVVGGSMGTPFPIPQSGKELMWNHRLRYVPAKMERFLSNVPVKADGSFEAIEVFDEQLNQWTFPRTEQGVGANILILRKRTVLSGVRFPGEVVLVHEPISEIGVQGKIWQYNPGTRRVRRALELSYDNPGSTLGGISTVDSANGFEGPLDRYDWSTTGQVVRLVPYNSYTLTSMSLGALVAPRTLNPDALRYEPHRVWVVEAKLRVDQKHAYHRRVLYLDEDTYAVLAAELYDSSGRPWRFQEIHSISFYQQPVCLPVAETVYDLRGASGYLAGSLINVKHPWLSMTLDSETPDMSRFVPEGIRITGR